MDMKRQEILVAFENIKKRQNNIFFFLDSELSSLYRTVMMSSESTEDILVNFAEAIVYIRISKGP